MTTSGFLVGELGFFYPQGGARDHTIGTPPTWKPNLPVSELHPIHKPQTSGAADQPIRSQQLNIQLNYGLWMSPPVDQLKLHLSCIGRRIFRRLLVGNPKDSSNSLVLRPVQAES